MLKQKKRNLRTPVIARNEAISSFRHCGKRSSLINNSKLGIASVEASPRNEERDCLKPIYCGH